MKKILLVLFCFAITETASSQILGNLVSIAPNSANQGQTLTTTITLPQNSWMMASPPCDNYGIYLEKQGSIIYSNTFTIPWMDEVEAEFTIPANADPGLYNVYVAGATWDWWWSQCSTIGFWEMLSGFEITGTTGIIGPASLTHAYVNYNSSTAEFTISPSANGILQIFDIYGKEIFTLPLNGKQSIILDKHLKTGIYYFRIGSHTGRFAVAE